uniref:Anaphase-promoting complex subunit 11 n=1 Tax=Lygus hesperus TaxID=30085 RepID=A0A0A9XQI9_LYGHE
MCGYTCVIAHTNAKLYRRSYTKPAICAPMKVRIERWDTVAAWTWDEEDGLCTICQNSFDDCCPNCSTVNGDCDPVWGECSHAFHLHCIIKWLESKSGEVCPLCRQSWNPIN